MSWRGEERPRSSWDHQVEIIRQRDMLDGKDKIWVLRPGRCPSIPLARSFFFGVPSFILFFLLFSAFSILAPPCGCETSPFTTSQVPRTTSSLGLSLHTLCYPSVLLSWENLPRGRNGASFISNRQTPLHLSQVVVSWTDGLACLVPALPCLGGCQYLCKVR